MSTLLKRVKRLEEACGFDSSGFPPGSRQWEEHWFEQIDRHARGEPGICIPIQAVRAWIQSGTSDDGDDDEDEDMVG